MNDIQFGLYVIKAFGVAAIIVGLLSVFVYVTCDGIKTFIRRKRGFRPQDEY